MYGSGCQACRQGLLKKVLAAACRDATVNCHYLSMAILDPAAAGRWHRQILAPCSTLTARRLIMFRFWKSLPKCKPRRLTGHRCRVEGLETRSLMAVVAAADPVNSKVLNVRGDAANDTAMVEVDKGGIHVYSLAPTGVKLQNFSLDKFNQINVGLGGGDDKFLLSVPAAAKGTRRVCQDRKHEVQHLGRFRQRQDLDLA